MDGVLFIGVRGGRERKKPDFILFANRDVLKGKKKSFCLCQGLLSINFWPEISLNHTHGALLLHNSKKEDKWGSLKLKAWIYNCQKVPKSHLTFTIRCPVSPWWLNTASENVLNPRHEVVTQRPEAWQPRDTFQKDGIRCL